MQFYGPKRHNTYTISVLDAHPHPTPFSPIQFNPVHFHAVAAKTTRKGQYKYVHKRTIEILQRAHIFNTNCCLKVHNAHLKLVSQISG